MKSVWTAEEADRRNREERGKYLVGEDWVIGVALGGEARAYPLRILNWHEIVNDTVGGEPVARLDEVEQAFTSYLDRPLDEIDPVERAVLRMASYELLARIDVPYKVIINESVNLTKKFGAEQAYKYINGVLDQTARRLRAVEHPKGSGGAGLLKK